MAVSELDAQSADELSNECFARLTDDELYWRDHQEFLEAHGYMLRPRYRPGWTPSWRGKPAPEVLDAEDAFSLPVSRLALGRCVLLIQSRSLKLRTKVMDATRTSDGTLVYIKRLRSDSEELQILSFLNSDTMRQDPRNHCIHLLDVLQDSSDPDTSFSTLR